MSALPQHHWTPERYLELEQTSEIRHEYYNGEIFAMAGASLAHNIIKDALAMIFGTQLAERPCFTVSSDMRLKINANYYTYPDFMVVCGTPQIEVFQGEQLRNPTVIIEILSPSTEAYDRGSKFTHYRTLPSLQEYLLISQDHIQIEHYLRQELDWSFKEATTLEAILELPSIGCQLPLAEVYKKVSFTAPGN